ncbi:serine/threonine-protein kinase [Frigoriglobus tundricola]|uniref:Protein kinase domain-containing protein n=1 Tax=Frigoriglobus tundricola TaxID=2774151 RepID=A0A6M5YH77_9BACT|nr:serine/threonine-protein kinase [Frigoriglobus tundricola]QJW92914.1 hypothetical protein FTUN_0411 [Frigoriglobus tundricola]
MLDPLAEPDSDLLALNSIGSELSDSRADTRPDPGPAEDSPQPTPGPHAPEWGTHPDPAERRRATGTGAYPPIPGYDVQQLVGHGGMGVVYRAVHRATGRTVALKLVNPSGVHDPQTRSRFDREVRTLAALKHPNIVPVYDAGDWHGFPYCAMEFVPGGTLSEHLDRVRADVRGAVRLMVKVARAVAAMHAAGVLHRDLKPLNILLGPNDEPMVADFGLVRWSGDESVLTITEQLIGTRVYMAPEQTLGHRADHTPACDIWALGVTLYEVLTSSRPFADDDSSNLYARIRTEEAPRIDTRFPAVPAELAAVVQKCLQKRPEDRYVTAAAVADDLDRWLRGEPSPTAPVPAAVITPQPARRSRRVRTLLVVTVTALLATGVGAAVVRRETPHTEPDKKTLAERVAAGEKVKLTDEKGLPLFPPVPVPGHEWGEKTLDGYHAYFSRFVGLVSLADEPWGQPIRVEADVGIPYSADGRSKGGIYVGRRAHTVPNLVCESLVDCCLTPRFEAGTKKPRLSYSNGLYWWTGDHYGTRTAHHEQSVPWSADGNTDGLRFAHLIVEVRGNEVRTTGDGVGLRPVAEQWALLSLNTQASKHPHLRHTFAPPAFGTGIGMFCHNTECVVANVTVSKLDP